MKELKSKVAVITGGAGGFGLGIAQQAVVEGMKVLIADVRPEALHEVENELTAAGGEVRSMCVDVRQAEQMEALAEMAVKAFGRVNLIFNNAGVFASGVAWETSIEVYRWVIDTNLMSVIYGIKSFVPRMIAQGDECHVVNVASGAGLMAGAGYCTYSATKHAVLALSECLYQDLVTRHVSNIGVTVVMPGYIRTDVMNPDKSAPTESVAKELAARRSEPASRATEKLMRQGVETGMPAARAAELVFDAIRNDDLYALPNAEPFLPFAKVVADGRVSARSPYLTSEWING
ncbi:MAG: SDR family NAD(P)-dependent oxidoreductase [Candidatus Binatia bacterium]